MSEQIEFGRAINWALEDALAEDESVILFGEDVADPEGGGVFKVTQGLSSRFGDVRVRSTPISEMGFVGAGVGAAIVGMRPVVEVMLMNFVSVCMDQITNHAAKLRFMSGGQTHVPLTIRTTTGAGYGLGGQHSDYLEAWFCHTPGIKVAMPSNPADAYGLMLSSIRDDDPVLFVENTGWYPTKGPAPERGKAVPLGKANIVREGGDVTLIGYARSMRDLPAAAEKLAAQGIEAEVIDLRTVAPLDMDTVLKSVEKTRRTVVVHEAVRSFGVGAEISSRIHEALFDSLKAPVQRIGAKDCPVPFSSELEKAFLYSEQDIIDAAISICN